MNHDTFTPEEQALIAQLHNLPKPELERPAFDAIRQQMFHEMDYPSVPISKTTPSLSPMMIVSVTLMIIILVIAIVLVILAIQNGEPKIVPTEVIVTETITPDPIVLEIGETLSNAPTELSPLPTLAPATLLTGATEISDIEQTIVPATETPSNIIETPNSIVATETVVPLIVIEGSVQAININVITVFDFDIQIDAGNPILTDIQIGDNVRIEGNMDFVDTVFVIVAVNITKIDVDIFVGNSDAAPVPNGIPPGCKVSKKGKIKCSKKSSKKS